MPRCFHWVSFYYYYDTSHVTRKLAYCICENKAADKLCAFVFATQIIQSLFCLNPKFQASSYLLLLHSPDCVGPGRKPRRPVFWRRGSYCLHLLCLQISEVHHEKNLSPGFPTRSDTNRAVRRRKLPRDLDFFFI